MYGYFVEWYYGKCKYVATIIVSLIFAGFFSSIANMTSISTMPSSVLYCVLALKIYFLYEYRDYKKLTGRRIFLILLLILIFGINLIPIFTNNNVDYSSSLGTHFSLCRRLYLWTFTWPFFPSPQSRRRTDERWKGFEVCLAHVFDHLQHSMLCVDVHIEGGGIAPGSFEWWDIEILFMINLKSIYKINQYKI